MRIGIIGLGLIGGSLGRDLCLNPENQVWGISRNPATCDQAIAIKAVHYAAPDISQISKLELAQLDQTDLIFVCTPIAAILPTIAEIKPYLAPHTVITDVGSVKVAIVGEAEQLWDRFIGSHPMAGTAFNGIQAAELELFKGRPCVVTPTDHSNRHALDLVQAVWQSLGAILYQASPPAHDRAVALISHLPVFVSASLIQVCSQEPDRAVAELAKQLASSGFRDTSRVGGGNPQLGRYMAEYNRTALLSGLKQYQLCLEKAIAQIEAEDWQSIESSLTQRQTERPDFLN
jgi:arogenate dehydrogenase (NADP+)